MREKQPRARGPRGTAHRSRVSPWPTWTLTLFAFGLWPLAFTISVLPEFDLPRFLLSAVAAMLLVLLLTGQGGGAVAKYWDSPALFCLQRGGMRVLTPLLLLYLAFALPEGSGLHALLVAQPLFFASVPTLVAYCWLTLGWSGLYDYNPLVLQGARGFLYASTLLLVGQLALDGARAVPLALWLAVPFMSRVVLWLCGRRYTLTGCQAQGDRVRVVTLQPCGRALSHQVGQFVYVTFPLSFPLPMRGEFPLSVAASPAKNPRFLLRLQHEQRVPLGCRLVLRSPQGHLFHRIAQYPRLILLAAGLGIGPYLSLFGQWQATGNHQPAELHWFVREHDAELLADELEKGQQRLTCLRVFRYTALTRPQISAVVGELLSVPDRESGVFFCGSLGFNRMVRQAALAREWPSALLNYPFI